MSVTLFSFIFVSCLFLFIIYSIRKGSLETKYSILWFFVCFVMMVLSFSDNFINAIGHWFNVYYPPSILFLFGLLFCFILIFDLTRKLSKAQHQVVTLAQEFAILKSKENKEE